MALKRQRQVDVCVFEARLFYIESFRTAMAIQKQCLKKKTITAKHTHTKTKTRRETFQLLNSLCHAELQASEITPELGVFVIVMEVDEVQTGPLIQNPQQFLYLVASLNLLVPCLGVISRQTHTFQVPATRARGILCRLNNPSPFYWCYKGYYTDSLTARKWVAIPQRLKGDSLLYRNLMFPHMMKAMPGEAIFFQSQNCTDIFVQEEMFYWWWRGAVQRIKSICGCLSSFFLP